MEVQKEMLMILHNLEEAIITKSTTGLVFCNKLGLEFITQISELFIQNISIGTTDNTNLKLSVSRQRYISYFSNFHNNYQDNLKSEDHMLLEQELMTLKIFKLKSLENS
jgi:hypothetical protein